MTVLRSSERSPRRDWLHIAKWCGRPAAWLVCLFLCTIVVPVCRAQSARHFAALRNNMVDQEIVGAGVKNPRVIQAMRDTMRHEFVPPGQRSMAYYDMALPIGKSQTISPPFIVAYMTEVIDPQPTDKILEIGTGSGYQAAVLSPLCKEVYSIEIVEWLGERTARLLKRLKYENVHTKVGDGYQGWPEHAPFDKIIVTCSPEQVPPALIEQLAEGGRMIVPVGERFRQTLYLLTKKNGELIRTPLEATLFVPMTGDAEEQRQVQPDPLHPTINNGSFEDLVSEKGPPLAWHYQRQLERGDENAPDGEHYVIFSNSQPGRGAQALQGFSIDGRRVPEIELSAKIRAKEVKAGQTAQQLPSLMITFYDQGRAEVGHQMLGPWQGTFDWRNQSAKLQVPPKTREAILYIGLMGATGELAIDDIQLTVPARQK